MELKQYLKMSQQLVMTPQLQQAIKLLQLSSMELAETVNEALMENPVLEGLDGEAMAPGQVGESIDKSHEPKTSAKERDSGSDKLRAEAPQSSEAPTNAEPPTPTDAPKEKDAGEDARDSTEMDWEAFVENYREYSYSPGAGGVRYNDDEMPTIDQTVATTENLLDHLDWQLGLTQFTDAEHDAAEKIIGNVNDAGYISPDIIPAIAEETNLEVDEVEAVLEVIQGFDPLGVCARSLRECLLVQARHHYPDDEELHGLIDRHLDNLQKRKVPPILKDLDIEKEDLRELVDLMGQLEPRPGRGFTTESTHYITPDVYVQKVGDDYLVTLNEDGLPKLKISNFYQNHIRGGAASGEEKAFIQEKFRSAVWLIRSIHQRQNTIRKVTESIMRFQREFLDVGVGHLRPLILRDVADDVGMHESTISRVTTNKYVHTPQGIFELKYFFNSRIHSSTGADLASESVKQRIKQLIAEEEPKKPYSDQKLCDLLGDEGTEIARRTVAKYREMLGILPSSKRKKLF